MRVLSLVTTPSARFYQQQCRVLRDHGVEIDTYSVPGSRLAENNELDGRTPSTYLRFYGSAVKESFSDYDLVHSSYGLTAPPAVIQPNVPSVLTFWGSDLMGQYGSVSKLCARYADEVVVMSTDMAETLGQACHIIPHGIDTTRFEPMDRETARDEIGWNHDDYHVLFPYATERPVKNYPRARHVVSAADSELEAQVRLHTVSGVPHDQMPYYFNAADVLLLTSDREGSPNSVKEALACNVPVVSTDVGDVSERLRDVTLSVVTDSDADLAAGLVEVLADGGRSNGRVMVDDIGLETQTERLYRVYESAIES